MRLNSLRPYLVLALLGFILYLPVLGHASTRYHDYGHHIDIALAMPGNVIRISHVLFSAVFLFIHRLLPSIALPQAALAAAMAFMIPVPLIAFWFLKKTANDTLPDALLMAFSLSLTIMAPVTIWIPSAMIGYMNPIVYHNPTIVAVRLFLIPVSLLALRIFDGRSWISLNHRVYVTLLCAVLVLLATLTKPSYTLVLIPGCCLFAAWRLLMRQNVDFPLLIFGICLPAILLLGLLYLLVYFDFDDGSSIAIGFLTFMKSYIPTWRIPIQLMLSLVFPLGVYICFWNEAREHTYLNMSWLNFAIGAAIALLLYEEGPRIYHGNFVWSGYSAVFVLMFASILFFVERVRSRIASGEAVNHRLFGLRFTGRDAVVILLFGLHVVSGIAYYYRYIT